MRPRQPLAVVARFRNGGFMKDRRASRGGARNEMPELLDELGSDPRDEIPETGETMAKITITFEIEEDVLDAALNEYEDSFEGSSRALDMLMDQIMEALPDPEESTT